MPFRNSKLTFLLQSSLGGASRCMFIFNASPAEINCEETRCTFKFASRMRNITLGAAQRNVDVRGLEASLAQAQADTVQSQRRVAHLEAELGELQKSAEKASSSSGRSITGRKSEPVSAKSTTAKKVRSCLPVFLPAQPVSA